MALGDGPVRRVLSLRGGRYFGKLLSGVGLSYESVTPDVTQAGWVHSLVHTTGAPSSSRRGCRGGRRGARGPTRLRLARDADGARPGPPRSKKCADAHGAGSASGCEPRATGDPSALSGTSTSIEYVTASGVRPRIELTKDGAMIV
jgi:hypothetical protein